MEVSVKLGPQYRTQGTPIFIKRTGPQILESPPYVLVDSLLGNDEGRTSRTLAASEILSSEP